MQFWGCGSQTDMSFAKALPGYGVSLKDAIKKRYPALVALHPYGEVLPRKENRITVEGTPLDKYGVPIARLEYKVGENEPKMVVEMFDKAEEILRAAQAGIMPFERKNIDMAGKAIHQPGTARKGADPQSPALNSLCQS